MKAAFAFPLQHGSMQYNIREGLVLMYSWIMHVFTSLATSAFVYHTQTQQQRSSPDYCAKDDTSRTNFFPARHDTARARHPTPHGQALFRCTVAPLVWIRCTVTSQRCSLLPRLMLTFQDSDSKVRSSLVTFQSTWRPWWRHWHMRDNKNTSVTSCQA